MNTIQIIKAIRKSDCGAWLKDCGSSMFTCADGRAKRQELARLLDDLYKTLDTPECTCLSGIGGYYHDESCPMHPDAPEPAPNPVACKNGHYLPVELWGHECPICKHFEDQDAPEPVTKQSA